MKKILALVVSVVMLLSVGAIYASAADFTPAGDIEITWYENAYNEIEIDGDLSDWAATGADTHDLTNNMADWIVQGATPAEDFGLTAMFVSDAYYLYIGLEIRDDEFSKVEFNDAAGIGTYKGDAFQFALDFGGLQGDIMAEDPEFLTGLNAQNSFFSFASRDLDGECTIVAQHTGIYPDVPLDREQYKDQMFAHSAEMLDGSGNVVGWYVEFRISWDAMFRNGAEKVWLEDEFVFDADNPLEMTTLLCYLDMDKSVTGVSYGHAYGTFKSLDDTANDEHGPEKNGLNLYLPYEEGRAMYIDDDRFVQPEDMPASIGGTEPGGEDSSEIEDTESAPVENNTTEAPAATTAPETEAPETEAPAATTAAPAATTAAEEGGCGGVIGASAAALVLAAAAAAVALKKRD